MKVDGSCHCGGITYEAEINPDHVVICHCTDCQTFSSAPYRVSVFGVPSENLRLEGAPKTYAKTGGSGRKVLVAFCGGLWYGSLLDEVRNLRTFQSTRRRNKTAQQADPEGARVLRIWNALGYEH